MTSLKKLSDEIKKSKDMENMIKVVTTLVDNWSKITSGDPAQAIVGVIEFIGSVGAVVGGPCGPLIAAGCGLIVSVLSLFTGGGSEKTSLCDQIKSYIDEAFADFKDEEMQKEMNTAKNEIRSLTAVLLGIVKHDNGIIKEKNEIAIITNVTNYVNAGNRFLGAYETQLVKYKTKNDNDEQSRRLAVYTFYYAVICNFKNYMLTLLCSLLKMNDIESAFSGVYYYQTKELPEEGRELLGFMSEIPDHDPKSGKNYWKLYRYLHVGLNQIQRSTLTNYRKYLKLKPMPGTLCTIYNIFQKNYIFASRNSLKNIANNRSLYEANVGRFVTRWTGGGTDGDCIWRIFDLPKGGKRIFNVYFSEYMYVSKDFQGYYETSQGFVLGFRSDNKRRLALTYIWPNDDGKIPYDKAEWKIDGDWENGCTVINKCYNEPLYASSLEDFAECSGSDVLGAGKDAYLCFTWSPANIEEDCKWIIKERPYDTTKDLNKAHES